MSKVKQKIMASHQLMKLPELRSVHDVSMALEPLRRQVGRLYEAAPVVSNQYKAHSEDVEFRIVASLEHLQEPVTLAERLALQAAALFHDIGYSRSNDSWFLDQREHVLASLELAERELSACPEPINDDTFRLVVKYLIAHHHDTDYQYPNSARNGAVEPANLGLYADVLEQFVQSLTAPQQQRLALLCRLLQEADALTSTGRQGAKRVFEGAATRDLPTFSVWNPANAWAWEASKVGNVLLAAKRALIDAYTDQGQQAARVGYDESARFVEALCRESGLSFIPETFMPFRHLADVTDKVASVMDHVTIRSYLPWDAVVERLRNVTLQVDRSLKPYATATIELKHYPIEELSPISTYVLNTRLAEIEDLQTDLCSRYALSIFDLTGLIEHNGKHGLFRQSPPIVERYFEATEGRMVNAIVDGLHRVWLARKLGVQEIWVAEISGVPQQFPVVSLPLAWDSVQPVDRVPSNQMKRKFRYPSITEFPDVSWFTSVEVTPANYLYFFYRDLAALGSSGIRGSNEARE